MISSAVDYASCNGSPLKYIITILTLFGNSTRSHNRTRGVFWKPIVNLLEAEEIEFLVVNAQHMKSVPGRKTDVKDAEWIA